MQEEAVTGFEAPYARRIFDKIELSRIYDFFDVCKLFAARY